MSICVGSVLAGTLLVVYAIHRRQSEGIEVNFTSVLGLAAEYYSAPMGLAGPAPTAASNSLVTVLSVEPTVKPTKHPSRSVGTSSPSSSSANGASRDPILNDRPNVIFILADDLGFNSIGNEDLDLDFATPFLSKLAKKSITIQNYYTQESCTPARAALLTGRYPLSLGMQLTSINAYATNALNKDETLLSDVLQEGGYTSYHLGKWNLGHFHPRYLPTARGFDYSLGYMDGQTYYWSKKNPRLSQFTDLMYGNTSCYSGYDGVDRHDYSTFLYRDKAINTIKSHDYQASPMFLYLALQAVHDPFYDYDNFESGIPSDYLSDGMYDTIISEVKGRKRRQYAMALTLLDEAVESVYDALDNEGQLDNSYVIFTSDNGGCYGGGGKNGEYRGGKGSLYEGGTKVDAFIYSPIFSSSLRGSQYKGLMHVSDWMPTILDMADLSYTAATGYELDGVSHWGYLNSKDDDGVYPRSYLLYNYIVDVGGKDFSLDSNAPVAVRNQDGFKLIHSYVGNPSTEYYDYDTILDDDSTMNLKWECTQSDSMSGGEYKMMLFDLSSDPYETTDLYDDPTYAEIKADLYAQIDAAYEGHAYCSGDGNAKSNKEQRKLWKAAGDYIIPWAEVDEQRENFPGYCQSLDHSLSPVYTSNPSKRPTETPTRKPSKSPTSEPSKKPSKFPTSDPSKRPTYGPTEEPSFGPTEEPSSAASSEPTAADVSDAPTFEPTIVPTNEVPTLRLTSPPTPTRMLTNAPTTSSAPAREPSFEPTLVAFSGASSEPTNEPSELEFTSPPSPSSMHTSPPSPSSIVSSPPTTRFDWFLSQEDSASQQSRPGRKRAL